MQTPRAGKACAFGYGLDWKIGVVQEALGTAHSERKRDLQRRCIEMFDKKPRQVT
jgi:hypothetical protein